MQVVNTTRTPIEFVREIVEVVEWMDRCPFQYHRSADAVNETTGTGIEILVQDLISAVGDNPPLLTKINFAFEEDKWNELLEEMEQEELKKQAEADSNFLVVNREEMSVRRATTLQQADEFAAEDALGTESIAWAIQEYGRCDGGIFTILPEEWKEPEPKEPLKS